MSLFCCAWKKEIKKHLETMSETHYPIISDIIAGDNKPVELTYDNCRFDAKIPVKGEEKPLYIVKKDDKGVSTVCINPEFYPVFKKFFEKVSND